MKRYDGGNQTSGDTGDCGAVSVARIWAEGAAGGEKALLYGGIEGNGVLVELVREEVVKEKPDVAGNRTVRRVQRVHQHNTGLFLTGIGFSYQFPNG